MADIKDISWVKHIRPEWDENDEEMQRIWSSIFKTGVRNIMMAFIVLLMLAFTASATDNGTNATSNATATGTAAPTAAVTEGTEAASDSEEELLDDPEEYDGPIGPGNSIYKLKLALEALDITFTFNESEKLGKQIGYARQRIAEMKAELKKNNNEAANRALEEHRKKIKELDEAISEKSDDDTGLLHAQKMIAKHQAILKELAESHPNNTGLARAYNNSLELKEKFESKTGKEYVIIVNKGKKVLREVEIDETKEKLKIKAEVSGNTTKVRVEVKFASNATDNFTIAQEILNRLELSEENINSIMDIEIEDEEEDVNLREKLEAKAVIRGNISKVEFEHRFPLNVTNRSEIAGKVHEKLSVLTTADILNVLEIKIKKERAEVKQREEKIEKRVKKEIEENEEKIKENEKNIERKVKEEMKEKEEKIEKRVKKEIEENEND